MVEPLLKNQSLSDVTNAIRIFAVQLGFDHKTQESLDYELLLQNKIEHLLLVGFDGG